MDERYQTIARELQAEIEAGTFAEGALLPTRAALASRFQVARATIDRAVTSLIKRGVLSSKRGSGTCVAARTSVKTIGLIGRGWDKQIHPVVPAGLRLEQIQSEEILAKSDRNRLRSFDGLIWNCPESRELEWARETPSAQPQLLINRHIDEFNYVSIDHRGAIRDITTQRLRECPEGIPVFLSVANTGGLVWGMREQGFVDACRAMNRFYEITPLPGSFNERVVSLNERFKTPFTRPLLLVSGTRLNTGSVIAWVRGKGLRWQRDVYYSDFDNDYPQEVWGLTVTSFIQDVNLLVNESIQRIHELISGGTNPVNLLIPPTFIQGDT